MSETKSKQGTPVAAASGASVGAVVAHIAPGVPDWRVVERVMPWGERWGLVRQVRVWAVIDPEGDEVTKCETRQEAFNFCAGVRLGWARRGEVRRMTGRCRCTPVITVTLADTGQWWLRWGRRPISAIAADPCNATAIRDNVAAMTGDRRAFDARVVYRRRGDGVAQWVTLAAAEVATWPTWKRGDREKGQQR